MRNYKKNEDKTKKEKYVKRKLALKKKNYK